MREIITRERERGRASETVRGRTNGIGGRDHKASGTVIVRKVTGRSRTAMRGEAALTVRRGCVGLGGGRERGTVVGWGQ